MNQAQWIERDIAWLTLLPECQERAHILGIIAKKRVKVLARRPRALAGQPKALRRELDNACRAYIRRRDCPDGTGRCITCGKLGTVETMDWGHFTSRRFLKYRWSEENTAMQCRTCNRFNEGEHPAFARAIDERYGLGTANRIETQRKLDPNWKPTTLWLTYKIRYFEEMR